MEEYEFKSKWLDLSVQPLSGTRCIVTDGDTIVIGTYVVPTWILDGVSSSSTYHIIGWMPVPRPMKKPVPYDDKTMAQI